MKMDGNVCVCVAESGSNDKRARKDRIFNEREIKKRNCNLFGNMTCRVRSFIRSFVGLFVRWQHGSNEMGNC